MDYITFSSISFSKHFLNEAKWLLMFVNHITLYMVACETTHCHNKTNKLYGKLATHAIHVIIFNFDY